MKLLLKKLLWGTFKTLLRFCLTLPPEPPASKIQFDKFRLVLCFCNVVTRSCLTLCDHMNWSPPGYFVHGIFQVWVVEWITISSSVGSSRLRDLTQAFCVSCTVGKFFTTELPRELYTLSGCVQLWARHLLGPEVKSLCEDRPWKSTQLNH